MSQEQAFPPGIAFIDGQFVPMSQAKISVLDWGFLRSDATYDVVHVWQQRFFRLDTHLDRFLASADKLRLRVPHRREEVKGILAECVRRAGLEDAYVEMIVTRGLSPTFSRDPRDAVNRFIGFAVPFGWILKPEEREKGLHIAISQIERIPPSSVDPTVKNYHWLDLVMGMFDGYEQGARTVVLVDAAGNVTEGPGFNLFVVHGGSVTTPATGVLHGITRRTALDLLAEIGVQPVLGTVSQAELLGASEVFVTSTAGGIMPVTRVGHSKVADGRPGALTRQLVDAYWQAHRRPEWSVAVDDLPCPDLAAPALTGLV